MGNQPGVAQLKTATKTLISLSVSVLLLAACAGYSPKLNQSYLPLSYEVFSIPWTIQTKNPPYLRLVSLNLNKNLNRQIVKFWRNGYFHYLFKKRHPVLEIHSSDISRFAVFLDDVLAVYYLDLDSPNGISYDELRQTVMEQVQCDPLSNLEIRFIMNADTSATFSQKPLSMLMISAHELMLQMGAAPVYPKVLSPYLRKKYGYADLKELSEGNIFAIKHSNKASLKKGSGFFFCRKERI